MAKRYFVNRKKPERDTGLLKIIAVLTALVAGIYFAGQAYGMLRDRAGGLLPVPQAAPAAQEPGRDILAEARQALDEGDTAKAGRLLGEWKSAARPRGETPVEAEILEGRLKMRAGDAGGAAALLEGALERARGTAGFPAAALALAKAYDAEEQYEKAQPLYTEVRERAPSPYREAGIAGVARQLHREGRSAEALTLFEQVMARAEPDSDTWNTALDALSGINVELIFSPAETPEAKYYVIEPGDSITAIGNSLNTTQGLLMRANSITAPERIRVGQRLKYTPKDFRIVIERSTCRLFLLDTNGIFKRYYVGLGKPGYETVIGKYTIGNKQKDPTWFKPGAGPVPPNDPENELGTRWMPLIPLDAGLPTDLGIHGTIAPESIGKYESHGCPRMHKDDVEELYDLVVRSTPVEIVETIDWSDLPGRAA